jgi:hypothetical protein
MSNFSNKRISKCLVSHVMSVMLPVGIRKRNFNDMQLQEVQVPVAPPAMDVPELDACLEPQTPQACEHPTARLDLGGSPQDANAYVEKSNRS